MPYFRKKPVIIEAFQWTGDENQVEDPEWFTPWLKDGRVYFRDRGLYSVKLMIRTLEGDMTADRGDWIIKGVHGEVYPCKPDIFKETYDPVDIEEATHGKG